MITIIITSVKGTTIGGSRGRRKGMWDTNYEVGINGFAIYGKEKYNCFPKPGTNDLC